MNIRRLAIDIAIVMVLYVLVEFGRTQEVRPDDWSTWGWGVIMGALYRATPELITWLGALRTRTGGGA